MTTFATALTAWVNELADAAECEFWQCHELPEGQHHEHCLTDCDAEGVRIGATP